MSQPPRVWRALLDVDIELVADLLARILARPDLVVIRAADACPATVRVDVVITDRSADPIAPGVPVLRLPDASGTGRSGSLLDSRGVELAPVPDLAAVIAALARICPGGTPAEVNLRG